MKLSHASANFKTNKAAIKRLDYCYCLNRLYNDRVRYCTQQQFVFENNLKHRQNIK